MRLWRSFRFRLALLSVLMSGLVLLGFSGWVWRLLFNTALSQIDGTLLGIGQFHLATQHDAKHWAFVDESLQSVFGEGAVVIRVADTQGALVHESTQWPFEGTSAILPEPGVQWEPESPPPGGRGRGGRRFNGAADPQGGPPMGQGQFGPQGPRGPRGPGMGPDWPQGTQRPQRGPEGGMGPEPQGPDWPQGTQRPQRGPEGGMGPEPRGPDWPQGAQRAQRGPEGWTGPEGGEGPPPPPPGGPPPPQGPRGMMPGGPGMWPPQGPPGPPGPPMPQRTPRFLTVSDGTAEWRVGAFGNPEVSMHVAVSLGEFRSGISGARSIFLISLPGALAGIALGSWFLASRALRPVHRLTQTIAHVGAKGLDQRVDVGDLDTEYAELGEMFNGMMARLEQSFQQATRFSADAAHELKTPLTILQGELEQALQHATGEQRKTLARLLEEVQRLKAIIQKLLLLALADAGRLKVHLEKVNLTEMVEELVEDAQILAPKLQVESRVAPGVRVAADRDLLRQALQNLSSNALKYTAPGGRVRFLLGQEQDRVLFRVQNQGEICAEDRARIFDRFYRADKARTREVDGVGLGLSLAREIARTHGGELSLDAPQAGVVSFTLQLPGMGIFLQKGTKETRE